MWRWNNNCVIELETRELNICTYSLKYIPITVWELFFLIGDLETNRGEIEIDGTIINLSQNIEILVDTKNFEVEKDGVDWALMTF